MAVVGAFQKRWYLKSVNISNVPERRGNMNKLHVLADKELIPHTSQWFDYGFAHNPHQTMHTKMICTAYLNAGGDASKPAEICSICGDEPSWVYRLIKPKLNFRVVVRLCADCYGIRKAMYKETYTTSIIF
jgi:hypothetical protein